ncbi:MAG TPA: C-GCAxxG-C-C family protein [Terriglobales bacterium]|nr:C-GCAxxG-C-C family protein [Terriglobales bacterium]
MTHANRAAALFDEGFSCSQAVLAAFAEDYGLERETALRLAQPFGGGIGRGGDWCGAVTGALMVIGLKHGRVRSADVAAKDRTYALVNEFIRSFRERHGAVRCNDLLGCEMGTPAGDKAIAEGKLHETVCRGLVRDAAEILDALL